MEALTDDLQRRMQPWRAILLGCIEAGVLYETSYARNVKCCEPE